MAEENKIETKDFLKSLFSFFRLVGTNWRLILIFFLVGTMFGLVTKIQRKGEFNYKSDIIFNLELNSGSSMGGLASAFNMFSGGGGSSVGGELFTSQNFNTILFSRSLYERIFFKEIEVNGDTTLMINYIIDSSDIKTKEWGGSLTKEPFKEAINYKFKKIKSLKELTPFENSILSTVYYKLIDQVTFNTFDTKGSVYIISVETANEVLSNKLVSMLLETCEEYYVEVKTQRTKKMLETQYQELGKLESQLNRTDSKLARLNFENPNVVDPMGRFQESQTNRKSSFLTTQYMAQLSNISNLNRLLIEQTPIFTILEETRPPLIKVYKNDLIDYRLTGFLLIFLAIFWIAIQDSYKKVMA